MKRLLKQVASSPVLAIGVVGLVAGLGLIGFGLLHGPARPGPARLVGAILIGLSSILTFPRLKPHAVPPPPRGTQLPPAQEAALDVKDVERQQVAAVGKS